MKTYITRFITPEHDVKFETTEPMSLEQAQALVGGYVEQLKSPEGKMMLVNEEGHFHRLPKNVTATDVWRGDREGGMQLAPLVGNVLVLENYDWE